MIYDAVSFQRDNVKLAGIANIMPCRPIAFLSGRFLATSEVP